MKIKIFRRVYCSNTNNTIEEITLLINIFWLIIWLWVPTLYAIFIPVKLARKPLGRKWLGPEAFLLVVVRKRFSVPPVSRTGAWISHFLFLQNGNHNKEYYLKLEAYCDKWVPDEIPFTQKIAQGSERQSIQSHVA